MSSSYSSQLCLIGPISLCVDLFVFMCVCVLFSINCICAILLQHGEMDLMGPDITLKLDAIILRNLSLFSALTLLVGAFDP